MAASGYNRLPAHRQPANLMPVVKTIATVISNQEIIKDHRVLVCKAPEIAQQARPGHFLNVMASETVYSILRKPFSVFQADPAAGTLSMLYQLQGATTHGMSHKAPGDEVDIVGPLGGKVFEPVVRADVRHIMVGGGYGVPPLVFLCDRLRAGGFNGDIAFIVGARSRERILCEAELHPLGVTVLPTTEDGTHGLKGRVTDALGDLLDGLAAVYTCGPTPMMRAVADMCLAAGVPCQVSLEYPMPCGVGVCMGCVCDTVDGKRLRACTDGPVFAAETVVWR